MSRSFRRTAVSLTIAVLAAVSLTGCAGKEKANEEAKGFQPALDTKTECSLNFAGGYSNFEALEEQIDRFTEVYPNVSIVYTALDDYNNTITTALAGSEAPDLFTTRSWMLTYPDMAGVFDYAQDLSEQKLGLNLASVREDLTARDAEGHMPMVPVFGNAYGMLVNEDIFKENKLEIPTTFAQMKETCDRLTELGYDTPVLASAEPNGLFEIVMESSLFLQAKDDPELIGKVSAGDKEAGELMRPVYEKYLSFLDICHIDVEKCAAEVEDTYNGLILRFFQGDVPMMITVADTASGTIKREDQSEAFTKNPFTYSFRTLPISDTQGMAFAEAALCFSVNKNSKNLAMADEFLRFLVNPGPLNEMAQTKHLLSTSTDMEVCHLYTTFKDFEPENVVTTEAVGLPNDLSIKLRETSYALGMGQTDLEQILEDF